MKLVWKLLRQHISSSQLLGFFLANLVGMVIILLGVQFYTDIQTIYNGDDSFMKDDYIIINKKNSSLSSLFGGSNGFTEEEANDLRSQPFVEDIGIFTPSEYLVTASFHMRGMANFSTEMFFESVPDKFIDVKSNKWVYTQGDSRIPIILPRNYLDLYNFGFAQSKNLPKLSENLLGMLTLRISITGNGQTDVYDGKIVGFSSRLNTILVPESFMLWANEEYSHNAKTAPARLIVQVNNPADEKLTTYLSERNYITDKDKLDVSKTTFMLRIIIGIVLAIGAVICLLSFFILTLSIYLLVQKNSDKIQNLLLLGYTVTKVALPYQMLAVGLNIIVLFLALALMLLTRNLYLESLINFYPEFIPSSILPALLVSFVLFFLSSVTNLMIVRTKVSKMLI